MVQRLVPGPALPGPSGSGDQTWLRELAGTTPGCADLVGVSDGDGYGSVRWTRHRTVLPGVDLIVTRFLKELKNYLLEIVHISNDGRLDVEKKYRANLVVDLWKTLISIK